MARTQTEYDLEVLNVRAGISEFTEKVARLVKFGDRDAFRRFHQLMILTVALECLYGYDVTCEILTDDEIQETFELTYRIFQSLP